jgi:hypothetical protein
MSLSPDDMNAVKALLKAGHVEQARTLLQSFKGEAAQAALVKFNERYPEAAKQAARDERIETQGQRRRFDYRLLGVGFTAILLIVVIALWQLPSVKLSIYDARGRLFAVCLDRTHDLYGYDRFTSEELATGCRWSVEDAILLQSEKIISCLESSGQLNNQLRICLDNESVYLTAN